MCNTRLLFWLVFVFVFFTWIEVHEFSAVALSKALHVLRTGHVKCECMVSEVLLYDCTWIIRGNGTVQSVFFSCCGSSQRRVIAEHTLCTTENFSSVMSDLNSPCGCFSLPSKAPRCAIVLQMSAVCVVSTCDILEEISYSPVSALDSGILNTMFPVTASTPSALDPATNVETSMCALWQSWAWPRSSQLPNQWCHVQSQHCIH